MNLSKEVKKHFESMPPEAFRVPNPIVPLPFENFNNDVTAWVTEDTELKDEIEENFDPRCKYPVAIEGIEFTSHNKKPLMYDDIVDSSKKRAHVMAIEAYSEMNPSTKARAALKISEVPEAYNVLALTVSTTYEEALAHYDKAVACAASMLPGDKLKQLCDEGKCFHCPYTRPYLRAVHGQANTLRKMGRYAESEEKYRELLKIDPAYFRYASSGVNWRFHFLEVLMKQGKDKEAYNWAHSNELRECYEVMSTQTAYTWSLALLEYRYKKVGFNPDYFEAFEKMKDELFAPIIKAFQLAPAVLDFLCGERKLPHYPIPSVIGHTGSLCSAAVYVVSNLSLWQETPGAIEWAVKYRNSYLCYLMLHDDAAIKEVMLNRARVENTDGQFKKLVKQGFFIELLDCENASNMVHEAAMRYPNRLHSLLEAKAAVSSPEVMRTAFYPLIQGFVCDDGPPLSMRHFIKFGYDPYYTDELGEDGEDAVESSAAGLAAVRGHGRLLHTILLHSKPKNPKIYCKFLIDIFISDVYDCFNKMTKKKCMQCKFRSGHSKYTNFVACITALFHTGFRPDFVEQMTLKMLAGRSKHRLAQAMAEQMKMTKEQLAAKMESYYGTMFQSCVVCGSTNKPLKKCSLCKKVYYCGAACQKKDWKQHKKNCQRKEKD